MSDASGSGSARRLVVFLHGLRPVSQARLRTFRQFLEATIPGSRVHAPELPYETLLSTDQAAKIARDVIAEIDQLWSESPDAYNDILLVGHSAGGALARKVFIGACGQGNCSVPFEEEEGFAGLAEARPWASRVSRIVMLAGLTTGWRISQRQRWLEYMIMNSVGFAGHAIKALSPIRFNLTAFNFRHGSPFIINTRLQWMALTRESREMIPPVVQVLGSRESIVPPDSSLDFDPALGLDKFFYLVEVPNSDHVQLLDVEIKGANGAFLEHNKQRRDVLRTVLTGPRGSSGLGEEASLDDIAFDFETLADAMPPASEPDIKNVVFVMHGIRDDGYWTKKLATRIKQKGLETRGSQWRSITPSYGYFTMLPFVFPWIRLNKVEWLMNIYAEARLRYPEATFHFVGHSNGTYLCAAAMEKYRGCNFERVVFAGSVVHPAYDWQKQHKDSGLRGVLNYVATSDYVVAMFPHALRHVRRFFDLGGAGHLGFLSTGPDVEVQQLKYIRGGHGAGIVEARWDEIASFLTAQSIGPVKPTSTTDFAASQSWYVRYPALASPAFVLLGALLLLLVFAGLVAAAADVAAEPFLTPLLAKGGTLPVVGDMLTALHDGIASLYQWWHSRAAPYRLAGLAVFVGAFSFFTRRF